MCHVYHYCVTYSLGRTAGVLDGVARLVAPISDMAGYAALKDSISAQFFSGGARIAITSLSYLGPIEEASEGPPGGV